MIGILRSKNRTQPKPATAEAVTEGLRTFVADLEAGDAWALDCISATGELWCDPAEWAAYPTSLMRQVRIAYFGKTGPGVIPDEYFDRLAAEYTARRTDSAA